MSRSKSKEVCRPRNADPATKSVMDRMEEGAQTSLCAMRAYMLDQDEITSKMLGLGDHGKSHRNTNGGVMPSSGWRDLSQVTLSAYDLFRSDILSCTPTT